MVSRTGILCNKAFEDNCLEYRALPVGYATIKFAGHQPNPEYMGIKTPKYQRASSKPMSADVLAVNLSKNFAGNTAANARQILDLYQREAIEFKPPPVNIVGEYEYRMNDDGIEQFKPEYTQPASIHPRRVRPSRGEQILTQSVGTENDMNDLKYEIALRKLSATEQKKASDRIYMKLQARKVNISSYFPEAQNLLDNSTKWAMFINKEDNRIRDTLRLIQAGRAIGANVNYMDVINPYALSPTKLGESSNEPMREIGDSSSTQGNTALSGASTSIDAGAVGQGVARNAKQSQNPLSY